MTNPRITVLGIYLPSADWQRCEKLIAAAVSMESESLGDVADQTALLAEFEETLRQNLRETALIEVLVESPDETFDMGGFAQPDPSLPKDNWQVAWNEVFLTADGEHVIANDWRDLPKTGCVRAAFYIHFWNSMRGLLSGYGPLTCPAPQAMPERLWRLAPYEMP
jgi:hypothetical protein